jgi:beta-lactamase class A
MKLFGRKKKSSDAEALEDKEGLLAKKPLRRRDNPASPRLRRARKKEPPKPWGRKERLILLSIIFVTAGTSFILALSARAWKLPGLPRPKAPSISIPFFSEEKIVIETREDDQIKAQDVINKFNQATINLSGVYGLYVIDLDSGFSYGVNETESFEPASLNKLPVMASMYREIELGNISLTDEYTLKNSDKIAGSGSLYGEEDGTVLTYEKLLRYMGQESDNTAVGIAKKILGQTKIDQMIDDVGMNSTVINGEEQRTTPSDIGLFFEKLWIGDIMSISHRDELLSFLTDTIYEQWLPAGIPSEVSVAHKFGREVHVVNDAGIVMTERPFVVVILSKGVVESEADEIFPELSRIVFDGQTND